MGTTLILNFLTFQTTKIFFKWGCSFPLLGFSYKVKTDFWISILRVIHFTEYRTCAESTIIESSTDLQPRFQWQWSNSSREKRHEWGALTSAGVYTPNNRCRPEAPLTSLTKLTPVKNVEEDKEVGDGKKEGTKQDLKKNHRRQEQRDVVKAGTQINDVH